MRVNHLRASSDPTQWTIRMHSKSASACGVSAPAMWTTRAAPHSQAYCHAMVTLRGFTSASALTVIALAASLVACTPSGSPRPTLQPTQSASIDTIDLAVREAKAATVAYIDAVSATRPAQPSTLDALYELTTGQQNDNDHKVYDQMQKDGWSIEGAMRLTLIEASRESVTENNARVSVCVDVENFRFFDETGTERIPPRTDPVQAVDVLLIKEDGAWLVEQLSPRDGEPTCS